MILDRRLAAAGHEDELLDAGRLGLLHRILDQRPVDDRQHFLRHGLGGRKKTGAEAAHREDGFAYGFECHAGSVVKRGDFLP